MKPYTVLRPVDYGKVAAEVKRYQAGEPIELDDADAKPLLDCRAIEEVDPKAKFQDAVSKAEAAARELEQAGGDPSAAARELQQRRQDEERALDQAIDAVAMIVSTGLLTAADAASQICEQAKRADHELVLDRIVARVNAMNFEKPADETVQATHASLDEKATDAPHKGAQPKPASKKK